MVLVGGWFWCLVVWLFVYTQTRMMVVCAHVFTNSFPPLFSHPTHPPPTGIAIMSSPYQGPLPIGSSSAPRIATTTSSAGVGSGGLPTGPLGTTSNPPSYGPLNPLRASVSSSSLVGLTGGPVGSYRQQQGLVRVSSSQVWVGVVWVWVGLVGECVEYVLMYVLM